MTTTNLPKERYNKDMPLGLKCCDVCPFRDKYKSIPHLDQSTGKVVNPQSHTFCNAVNDWVQKDTPCEGESVLEGERYTITCRNCGKVVGNVSVSKNNKVFNFVYTENLDSRRIRGDKLVGLECNNCGESTLLSDDIKDNQAKAQYLKSMENIAAPLLRGKEREDFMKTIEANRVTSKAEAHWNELSSKFIMEKEV